MPKIRPADPAAGWLDYAENAVAGLCRKVTGLCPGTRITGGKVMSGKTKRCANRAAQALRLAAAALRTSQSALGAYFRRMCARMDKPKAVAAAAHKLARLIYTMPREQARHATRRRSAARLKKPSLINHLKGVS